MSAYPVFTLIDSSDGVAGGNGRLRRSSASPGCRSRSRPACSVGVEERARAGSGTAAGCRRTPAGAARCRPARSAAPRRSTLAVACTRDLAAVDLDRHEVAAVARPTGSAVCASSSSDSIRPVLAAQILSGGSRAVAGLVGAAARRAPTSRRSRSAAPGRRPRTRSTRRRRPAASLEADRRRRRRARRAAPRRLDRRRAPPAPAPDAAELLGIVDVGDDAAVLAVEALATARGELDDEAFERRPSIRRSRSGSRRRRRRRRPSERCGAATNCCRVARRRSSACA